VCIGPNGKLSITGGEFVTGNILLASGATFSKSGPGTIGGMVEKDAAANAEVLAAIAAAKKLSNDDAALPCTQGDYTGSITAKTTNITGTGGVNVICLKDVVLNGGVINLIGGSNDSFVLNVKGKFVLNGTSKIHAVGVPFSAVVYNILGTGQQVAFTGGGGGTGCCKSSVDGTLVALTRDIALSPGLVNGQLYGGQKITIVSGSSVKCTCVPGAPTPG